MGKQILTMTAISRPIGQSQVLVFFASVVSSIAATRQTGLEKIKDSLEGAVTGYKKIFSSTDMKDDKNAEKDFYDCLAYGNKILAGAAGAKTDLKNYASKADGWQFDWK